MTNAANPAPAKVAADLHEALGDNLVSCCLYGSAARGNAVAGVSDVNLLIVLRESSASAHGLIARVLARHPQVDPLVLAERNLARTARCFAAKFSSIQRNYRVLHGADPLAGFRIDPQLERLLCEQSVRNLRLRLAYAFIRRDRPQGYNRFVTGSIASVFVNLAEILRLNGAEVPPDFAARIPLMQRAWPAAADVLRELANLRQQPRALTEGEIPDWHERLLALLDAALATIESEWAEPASPRS